MIRFQKRPVIGARLPRQQGFSLLEVLIALLVLGVGLLGLALLQTTNLRFTQSANQRTQAANLASNLFDIIRSNHTEAPAYVAITEASFDDVSATLGCDAPEGLTAEENMERWRCEVVETLGDDAFAIVDVNADREVTVQINWGDEWWVAEDDQLEGSGTLTMETRL